MQELSAGCEYQIIESTVLSFFRILFHYSASEAS